MSSSYTYEQCLNINLYKPLQELDDSWLTHDNSLQHLRLVKNWRNNPNINKWFTKKHGFYSLNQMDFDIIGSKICLVKSSDLIVIFLYLGTLLHHQLLNSVGFVSEKNKIIEMVGEEMYKYCLNQGKYLLSDWPEEWKINSFEKFSYEYILESGLKFILSLLNRCDDRVRKLIQYKIPHEYSSNFTSEREVEIISSSQINVAYYLIVKLTKRVNYSCFHLLK